MLKPPSKGAQISRLEIFRTAIKTGCDFFGSRCSWNETNHEPAQRYHVLFDVLSLLLVQNSFGSTTENS
jgi:hypothetical protein